MNLRRQLIASLLLSPFIFKFSSCSKRNFKKIGYFGQIPTIKDFLNSSDLLSLVLKSFIYENIFYIDKETNELNSNILSNWGFNDTQTSLYMTIKNDIYWHDKRALQGSDLEKFLNRLLYFCTEKKIDFGLKEVTQIEKDTVSITLDNFDNSFLFFLCSNMVTFFDEIDYTIGFGPYKIVNFEETKNIELEKSISYNGNFSNKHNHLIFESIDESIYKKNIDDYDYLMIDQNHLEILNNFQKVPFITLNHFNFSSKELSQKQISVYKTNKL